MKLRKNDLSWFTEPGDPPACDEEAEVLQACSPVTIVSTLLRVCVPVLFPPRQQHPSAAADNPLPDKEIQETS